MSTTTDKKLFLLDAYALIYRAYFALNSSAKGTTGFHNSKGFNTSTVYGFTNTLLDLLQKDKPSHIAVVFDAPGQTDRAVAHDFYKANRQEMPDDIRTSIPVIKQLIKAFDIPILELAGYEADDIICTIAKQAERDGYQVYMVTPDKDFGQAVSDNICIYKPAYKGGGFDKMGTEDVLNKWGIKRVDQVIDILGLMGDAVDNIPGVPGVGEKTAAKLLQEFDTMEGIYENLDKVKGKLKENLETYKDQAFISKHLATIICDVPITVDEEQLVITQPDKEALMALFAELEFRTMGKRVFGDDWTVNQAPAPAASNGNSKPQAQLDLFGGEATSYAPPVSNIKPEKVGQNIHNTPHEYHLMDTPEKRKELIKILSKHKVFSFDTETTAIDANDCEMVGMSFSIKPGEGYYVPVSAVPEECQAVLEEFKPLLENPEIGKIGQNIKYDILVLKWNGINLQGELFDTMLAHYLLDPESRHNMDVLAENYLGYTPVSITELIGKKGKDQGTMRDVEIELIKEYATEDADITLQLKEKFEPLIKEQLQEELFYKIETPLVYALAEMEYNGILVDRDFLGIYSKELAEDIAVLQDTIFTQAGTKFNIDSPKQLGDVLFLKMGIPYSGKKTKTGQYSTGEDILSRLEHEHTICSDILNYRELVKLKSTYVDSLPLLINPKSGRIHSSFNQAVAATGRLSSQNPNLQNIPIRTEKGRRIRKAFIPRDADHVLLSADYSQIELRLVADISKDEAMLDAFNKGLDIHTATAAKVYNVALEDVTSEQRRNAKAVNFGIAYGTTAFGLSQNLNIPRREAQELIDAYFAEYKGLKQYMSTAVLEARENGYALTLKGRRRYLPDIHSGNQTVRAHAERNAVNAPIQGTAADMIKIAMVDIHREIEKQGLRSRMVLQVHDELVFDVHKDELETLKPIVETNMRNALKLTVPIVVEMGVGQNWLEAH
jgi:DNA polymerase-1